jgi:hypothetical protein
MIDDNNPLHAGHRAPVRQRRPGELIWTVQKNHVTWTCELKFHGESYGWEAQIYRETDLRFGWCLEAGGKIEVASSSDAVRIRSCARLAAGAGG